MIGAVPLTIGVNILKYFYQDWEFAKWIGFAVVLDTAVSIVKHWLLKDLSSEEFWCKFGKKIFVYLVLLMVSNLVVNFQVNNHTIGATQWLGEYICVFMLVREVISVVENTNAIYPWCPVWLLKRLKDYNEKGEYVNKTGCEQYDPEQNMED